MIAQRLKQVLTVIIILFLFALNPCFASAESPAYRAVFSVKMIDADNTIPDNTKFELVIEAQNRHYPLPVPNRLTVDKNGIFDFAPVVFTEPGNYEYTVKEIVSDDENLVCDTKEYSIHVTVIRGESGALEGGYTLSLENDSDKPLEISFTNSYQSDQHPVSSDPSGEINSTTSTETSSESPSAPGTGEPLSPAFWIFLLSGMLVILFFFWNKYLGNNEVREGDGL